MGWSCRADAGRTMRAWTDACAAQTGSQNVYEVKGERYFWEVSSTEHRDGAITGTVFKMLGESSCRKVGSFRIEPDGSVGRAPGFLKAVKVEPAPMFQVLPGSGG